jgi:hypothetical protein
MIEIDSWSSKLKMAILAENFGVVSGLFSGLIGGFGIRTDEKS